MRRRCCHSRDTASRAAVPLFAMVVLLCVAGECSAQITVRLHRDPVVGNREVRLDDVATITATSPQVVARIGEVDIATIAAHETGITLPASRVRIRLMLAGWRQSALVVEGPEHVMITFAESLPITDADVERAAQKTMLMMFGTTQDNVRVRLTDVFMSALSPKLQEQSGLRVEVSPPVRAELGLTSMRVRLWKGDNLVATRLGRFNVMKRHRVAVTRISLQRESVIGEGDVQFESRFLSKVADEPNESDVYGRSVRSTVGPGKILSLRDLGRPVESKQEVAVKARDTVQVTVTGSGLRIRLAKAEALQDGRVGDVIRVRNSTSNEVITGRVVRPGELEIDMTRDR